MPIGQANVTPESLVVAARAGQKPIRLAFVITELLPGGAERCLVELATRLDRQRFTPVVYSLGPRPPADRLALVERLEAAGIPTHFLNLNGVWQFFRGVRRLAAMFREQQPDIVQTFLFHANVLGARAARAAAVPHLMTGIRVADPRRWRGVVERWATWRANRFVCVSQGVKDFCERSGFATQKLVVIPNGIEIARWANAAAADLAPYGVPAARHVFLYVGRLDEQKGLDRFFAELPQVFRELPSHDFLLVGDGPQRSRLQILAQQLQIADRVHFAGWQCEVPALLAAADLLVLPSRWEGMPNVILEAMAAAKPVVASRAEGVMELLGTAADTQTAVLSDYQMLRSKLVTIASNQQITKDLGRDNQARARSCFSLSAMVESYERLFSSPLAH